MASSLCAVHCALCAAAPAVFTALGLGAWLSHEVELGLTLVVIVGLGACGVYYQRREQRKREYYENLQAKQRAGVKSFEEHEIRYDANVDYRPPSELGGGGNDTD